MMTTGTKIFMNALAAIVLAALTMQSCCKTRHTDENGSVSVALSFADENDLGEAAINDVKLWIFDDKGGLVGRHGCSGASELSLQRYFLGPGRYLFVTAVNLDDPFTWTELTKATDAENLMFGLNAPAASPSHAYYGVTEVFVDGDRSKVVTSELRRVLSELTVRMTGAPSGSSLKVTVRSVATGVYPAIKDGDGFYGLASRDEVRSIGLPEGHERGDTITLPAMRLMPTIGGSQTTILYLTTTLADGNELESVVMAPAMRPSGKYILMIDYATMRATMVVNPYKINAWTEGWVVNGEILDPDDR